MNNHKEIMTMQEWMELELSDSEQDVVIGSPTNAIVRPKTKNLIEAPEKSFKTTVTLRLMAGLSCGTTVFPKLPIVRPRKVLYLHGELSSAEIKDRTIAASANLAAPFTNLLQGRNRDANLIDEQGQKVLEALVAQYRPEDLVLDPWQSFIAGSDENSFKEMSRATKFCDYLIENYGVTLWIPIHLGKVHKRGARGHSVIAGWRDTRIQLARTEHGVTVAVEPRWAAPVKSFGLRFDKGTVWPDSSIVGWSGDQTARIKAFVELHGGKVLREELAKHLGKDVKGEDFRKAVERAEKSKAVSRQGEYVLAPLGATSNPETIN